MTRPILVFGAGGRVGGELRRLHDWRGMVFFGPEADITDRQIVQECVAANPGAAAIINLAACTLPQAEKPEAYDEALLVNSDAVQTLSRQGVPVVHISTDCVFGGNKPGAYEPDDAPEPINHYGFSKWRGELHLVASAAPHIILRTTGVYLRDKPNFLKLVLDKARAGESMEIIADTLYSPTDARELAKAILLATERVIEDPGVSGTYHFAGPDHLSYLDFAKLALEEAGLEMEITPVTLADREKVDGFKRPRNASLNSDKFAETFGLRHRPTRECLRELLSPH